MAILYGAGVQGIQSFIFSSNKLRDMVGASELVTQVADRLFFDIVNTYKTASQFEQSIDVLVSAAGNIRAIINDESLCRYIVRRFPMKIALEAPGLSFAQAVVEFEKEPTGTEFSELERRLQIQRNKLPRPSDLGAIAMVRSRRTGLPATIFEKKEPLDQATLAKRQAVSDAADRMVKKLSSESQRIEIDRIPFEINDIIRGKENSWVAVIHADGNNLGSHISQLRNAHKEDSVHSYRRFSSALDACTVSAVREAIAPLIDSLPSSAKYSFRPIILGGDDLTLICRADQALSLTKRFLQAFEETTGTEEAIPGEITACAGIAYVKSTFPFHYAVDLADDLCSNAKRVAKSTNTSKVPAAICIGRVTSSYAGGYETMVENELTTPSGLRFDFGPYGLDEQTGLPQLATLMAAVEQLKEHSSLGSALRRWLSLAYNSQERADQFRRRIAIVHSGNNELLDGMVERRRDRKYSPVHDWIMLTQLGQNGDEDRST